MRQSAKRLSSRDLVNAVRIAARMAEAQTDANPLYVEALKQAALVLEAVMSKNPRTATTNSGLARAQSTNPKKE